MVGTTGHTSASVACQCLLQLRFDIVIESHPDESSLVLTRPLGLDLIAALRVLEFRVPTEPLKRGKMLLTVKLDQYTFGWQAEIESEWQFVTQALKPLLSLKCEAVVFEPFRDLKLTL